ncbi:MAG: hypothetical protein HY791_34910 [Deltaproteobacteria bacterium]|nr:hypothetical protein [Deltaproteobacteria bacterium]
MSPHELIQDTAREIAARCPRLTLSCYWAGTSVISLEELHHRSSFDLDFHTLVALQDTRPFLAELELGFPGHVRVLQPPDRVGAAFSALLRLKTGENLPVQVLSNYEDVPESDIVPSRSVPGLVRVSLLRYLADKIQCVAERVEARDLFDIESVITRHPRMAAAAQQFAAGQDALILAERLTGWTDDAIANDLAGYSGVDPRIAANARERLLRWLRDAAK